MSFSTQTSKDKIKCNNGFPGSPKFKFERVLKPDLIKFTDKTIMLAKIKNSREKPSIYYAYKVQKLVSYGKKKPRSPKTFKSRKPKEPKDMFDEDFPILKNDDYDADLTPRNRDEKEIAHKNHETATQIEETSYDKESSNGLSIWHSGQGQVILTMDSKPSSDQTLATYVYSKSQTTVNASWKNFNDMKLQKQTNYLSQDAELIRYGTKTFKSQQTSTSDLFEFRKLSAFASAILQKCHELEQMQFNSSESSFQDMHMGKALLQTLPYIPDKTVWTSQDSYNKMLCVYENKGKPKPQDLLPTRDPSPNSIWYWINPINILTFIALLVIFVGMIYIRFQMRPPVQPPFWRQYLNNLVNLIHIYK